MTETDPAKALKDFQPTREFFVGIDSDGCVFDTMGIKQRECFCPWLIAYFGLQPVAQAARECKEFADLFSKTRGANRHKTVKRILSELLPSHPMVKERSFEVPQFPHYFAWVDAPESLLSNQGLRQAVGSATDPEARAEFVNALDWSEKVNEAVAEIVKGMPPFPFVRESLGKIGQKADAIVISSTPYEALAREWQEHELAQYVAVIAGQEMGTKTQHLEVTTKGKYPKGHVLMVGDAPGDMKAAKANGALFFPINPGDETACWKKFYEEALDKFLSGQYAGEYEQQLISDFDRLLPDEPPWKRI
jgi:phosphoglycolate phosphatase-like HAD superfamily hydrolase